MHTIIGSAVNHTLNRHGEGNEKLEAQLPVTDADIERIPEIIANPDEIRRGFERTTGNLNDTIVYQKRINGHVLIVEEVRTGRRKLAFHTMRKAKAGYVYDLSREGQPIVKAKSEGVNVQNGLTPEAQLPNALSDKSVTSSGNDVNSTNSQRIRRTNDSFITPSDMERFEQVRTHATGHIILGNQFDLSYIGTGEGSQAYGWGIYFEQSPEVAEHYRKYGAKFRVRMKDGSIYSGNDEISEMLSEFLSDYPKNELRNNFEGVRDEIIRGVEEFRDNCQANAESRYNSEEEAVIHAEAAKLYQSVIDVLKNAKSFEGGGNIYIADIPENNVLIDWDADIHSQPEEVKKGMRRAIEKARQLRVTPEALERLKKSPTGEQFYRNLEQALKPLVRQGRLKTKKHGTLERADMAASLILNKAGIPGLRFWDRGSRDKKSGTHNFVIWNTDMIKLLGLTADSDEEARQYYLDYARSKRQTEAGNETFKQIIGIDGARRLDEADGTTIRMDNLRVARRMERKGLPVKKMWLATGWMRGADGKWRYELMDGKIIQRKLREASRYSKELHALEGALGKEYINDPNFVPTPEQDRRLNELERLATVNLSDIFDAPELFRAYPRLRNVSVWLGDLQEADAMYYPDVDAIEINTSGNGFNSKRELRKSIIHEIQHAIQLIEGFGQGSGYSLKRDTAYGRLMKKVETMLTRLDSETRSKILDILGAEFDGDNAKSQSLTDTLSETELDSLHKIKDILDKAHERSSYLFSKYQRHSGETEARNAETRAYWNEARRKRTPLDASEDTPRSEQIIGRPAPRVASSTGQNETYKQIIGIEGARRIDQSEGSTIRMDNLNIARRMERKGLPAKNIWLATGWMRGTEGKWRYELMDGKLVRRRKFNQKTYDEYLDLIDKARVPMTEEEAAIEQEIEDMVKMLRNGIMTPAEFQAKMDDPRYNPSETDIDEDIDLSRLTAREQKRYEKLRKFYEFTELQEVFDAPELYVAYPELRHIRYAERDFSDRDTKGVFSKKEISVDSNTSTAEVRNILIHEIQHAIQDIEGFTPGDNDSEGATGRINDTIDMWNDKVLDAQHKLTGKESYRRVDEATDALYDEDFETAERLARNFSEDERAVYEEAKGYIEKILELRKESDNTKYHTIAGEVEARNVMTRRNWSKKKRRSTPLDMSEDTPRAKQWVRTQTPKAESHYEGETYRQPLNNDVDLDRQVQIVRIADTLPNVPFYMRIKAFGKSRQEEIISRFKNGAVVNEHTGLTITLSRQGLNHILDTARNNDNMGGSVIYQSVPYLDSLARNAYRVETHEDRKPSVTKIEGQKGNLKQVHRFLVPVELDGDIHILKLTAKEYDSGETEIDEVSLYDMKYTKKMSAHPSQNSPNLIGRATGTIGSTNAVSVRDMLEGVNDVFGNPYSQVNETYRQSAMHETNGAAMSENDLILTPEDQKQNEGDVYKQVVGYGAAVRLDERNGNHNFVDNLRIAQRMEKKLKPDWQKIKVILPPKTGWSYDPDTGRDVRVVIQPETSRAELHHDFSSARTIWQATGWFRGADGQWKMELPYGNFIATEINRLINNAEYPNTHMTPETKRSAIMLPPTA